MSSIMRVNIVNSNYTNAAILMSGVTMVSIMDSHFIGSGYPNVAIQMSGVTMANIVNSEFIGNQYGALQMSGVTMVNIVNSDFIENQYEALQMSGVTMVNIVNSDFNGNQNGEEQPMLSHQISQLMDQHLITADHVLEDEFILTIQLLRLTTQHSAKIEQVIVEERSAIMEDTLFMQQIHCFLITGQDLVELYICTPFRIHIGM